MVIQPQLQQLQYQEGKNMQTVISGPEILKLTSQICASVQKGDFLWWALQLPLKTECNPGKLHSARKNPTINNAEMFLLRSFHYIPLQYFAQQDSRFDFSLFWLFFAPSESALFSFLLRILFNSILFLSGVEIKTLYS